MPLRLSAGRGGGPSVSLGTKGGRTGRLLGGQRRRLRSVIPLTPTPLDSGFRWKDGGLSGVSTYGDESIPLWHAPLWIPAFAGMTRGGFGPASAVGGGGGSSRCGGTALREPQGDRNRESPLRRGAGESGMRWGLVAGLPRSAPLWIPASAGTTMGGIRAGECCWWRRGKFPLRRDGAIRESPLRRSAGESGMRWGLVVGLPRSAPLWIPASAGTTMGGVRAGKCCGWRRLRFPPPRERRNVRAIRRETEAPPSLAPALGSRFRGKDDGGAAPFVCPQDRLRQAQGERTRWDGRQT